MNTIPKPPQDTVADHQTAPQKRPYATPVLTKYGAVEALTKGTFTNTSTDAAATSV
jgi:hypothetical protein